MVAQINTVAFAGIDVLPIEAQVAISSGLPTFTMLFTQAPKSNRVGPPWPHLVLPVGRIFLPFKLTPST
jgi:hypothetical protein